MTTPAMTDLDRERADFEAAARRIPECCEFNYARAENGTYADSATDAAWLIWFEASSAPPQQVVAGSIDSPEFNDLLYLFGRAFKAGTHDQVVAAGNAIIAHIDARPAAPVKGEAEAGATFRVMRGSEQWVITNIAYEDEVCTIRIIPAIPGTAQQHAGAVPDEIRAVIISYYEALSAREHGGVALDRAFKRIESALGMNWDEWRAAASMTKEG